MVIVKEHWETPVATFPEDVRRLVNVPGEATRVAIIKLVEDLIADDSRDPYVFGTWAELLEGAWGLCRSPSSAGCQRARWRHDRQAPGRKRTP